MLIRIQSPAIINNSWKWLEVLFHGLKIKKNISSALKPKLLITAPAPQSNSATAPQTNLTPAPKLIRLHQHRLHNTEFVKNQCCRSGFVKIRIIFPDLKKNSNRNTTSQFSTEKICHQKILKISAGRLVFWQVLFTLRF